MMAALLTWSFLAALALWWSSRSRFFTLHERPLFHAAPRFVHLLLACVCMLGPAVALMYIGAKFFPPGTFPSIQQHLEYVLSIQLISYALTLIGYAMLFYALLPSVRETIWHASSGGTLSQDAKQAGLALILSLPVVMALQGVLDELLRWLFNLPILPDQTAVYILKNSINYPLCFLEALIAIIFCAPVVEELFFRGFLQSYLRRHLPARTAILTTAFIFSSFHFAPSQGLSNIPIICALFVLASFLGFLYEKQRSLRAPILLHVFFNTFNAIQLYFTE